ncbi:major pollen allergen Ole e 10-like [Lycium ferocissimum]|uniref:major pollen allergen Ole e 10-like n=1 Tax=Lycium ferocissimum TaxID=112874 RepID=UPI00281529BC|nr:major pollen allergen Ole e 10-like [Lycium ferocissimum]
MLKKVMVLTSERNFGLFRPDFTPIFNIGIMKGEPLPVLPPQKPLPKPAQPQPRDPTKPGPRLPAQPLPKPAALLGKKLLTVMPKVNATDAQLQANLNWACHNQGVNRGPVQVGGPCFSPNTVRSHAAFVMNSYYQIKGRDDFNCDFLGSGVIIFADPSYGTCKYLS